MDVKIKMNGPGSRTILTSKAALDLVVGIAREVDDNAGTGHVVDQQVGAERVRASVRTGSPAAKKAQAKDQNLMRALAKAKK